MKPKSLLKVVGDFFLLTILTTTLLSCGNTQLSPTSQVTMAVVKAMGIKGQAYGPSDKDQPKPPANFSSKFNLESKQFAQRPVWYIAAQDQPNPGPRVLFLHGGAYAANFYDIHWTFIEWLVSVGKAQVIAPDYALVPQGTAKQALALLVEIWQDLLANDSIPPLVIGDSAGGGLALALAMELKRLDLPQPQGLILLSPWLDVDLNNPDIAAVDALDPLLSVPELRKVGQAWAAESLQAEWQASPVRGALGGLAPIELFTSSADLLNPDAHLLQARALEAGQALQLYQTADILHDWVLLGLPESEPAKLQILGIIQSSQE